MTDLIVQCPNCNDYIIINEKDINCMIFRHAVFKDTLLHIDPHAPEYICSILLRDGKIYGCAKPFRLVLREGIYVPESCSYI